MVRRGTRAGSPTLVVHLVVRDGDDSGRVGFVVSRSVGGAVVRNRVKRRLRQLMAARLEGVGTSATLVVRANPPAAAATFADLAADLDSCLSRAFRPRGAAVAATRSAG